MAGTFQTITMTVAGIILIICLAVMGVFMYRARYTMKFPPVAADCPDYWLDMSDGDGSKCVNAKNLGSCNVKEVDFSSGWFKGATGQCLKSMWARSCGLTWDGITNDANICSDLP